MKTSLHISYVDDNYDERKFFKMAAEQLGHRVTLLKDGPSLITSLHQSTPDVIFMDIYLKTFNGIEMLTFLKKCDAYQHIPVVMVSGIYPKQIVGSLLMCGACYLLKKSVVKDYAQTMERVLQIDIRWPIILN